MSVEDISRDPIASIPESSRWKVYREIDFENKDIRGQTIPQHLGRIADGMIDWRLAVADQLRLTEADKADILFQGTPGLQRRRALNIWKARVGAQGTYEALMEVFVRANKKGYAEIIVDILSEGAGGSSGDSPVAGVQAFRGAHGTAATPQNIAAQVHNPSSVAIDGGSLSFSPNMKPDQLTQWLLQEFGEDYKDDINQLKKHRINGKLFLMLPENEKLLKSLDLPYPSELLILDKVKELDESMANLTTTPAGSSEANLPRPPSNEVPVAVPQIFECGTAELDVPPFTADSASPESGELSAWVPKNVIWPKDKKVLEVKFLNVIPTHWTYEKGGLNRGNIKQWANIWSDRGDGNIPWFKFVDGDATSDIRVKFVDNEPSRSKVGRKAEDEAQDKPTMWLNLHNGGDDYKEHVVIHEFGHALGLGHEHQRSDFWKRVKSCIDEDAIKSDVGEEGFKINWGKDGDYKKKNATSYDPLSIMHYPFKEEWLIYEYSDTAKVKKALNDGDIGSKVADVLLGILKRAKNPHLTEPSKEDINLLKQLYSQGSSRGSCTIQAPPSRVVPDSPIIVDSRDPLDPDTAAMPLTTNEFQDKLNDTHLRSLFEQLEGHAATWTNIGTHLGFRQKEIKNIQGNPMLMIGAPGSWLKEMLSQWLEWNVGDKRGSTEYPTLKNLKTAVDKAGLGRSAAELHL